MSRTHLHKISRGIILAGLSLIFASTGCAPAQSQEILTPTVPPGLSSPTPGDSEEKRQQMVDQQIAGRGIQDPLVLSAMREVPRHEFVPDDFLAQAYADHPVPIGFGQTISQPYIVALMSEALEIEPGEKVLEIGTGSGYQAAVLAEMGAEVYSVEIITELAERAAADLEQAGYETIQIHNADGYYGWSEHAPFAKIIVTAAPDHLPQPLIQQLDDQGKLVIPIGPTGAVQSLWLFQKVDGELESVNLGSVVFVPLTGKH